MWEEGVSRGGLSVDIEFEMCSNGGGEGKAIWIELQW